MDKKLVIKLDFKNIETLTVNYDRNSLVKNLKKAGKKSLGGFSIEDALETAWLEGAKLATDFIRDALNIWLEEEKE